MRREDGPFSYSIATDCQAYVAIKIKKIATSNKASRDAG